MPNAGFSFLNIARENGLSTADAIQNANNIQKYLATPEADRNSLDGLDAAIAALSFAATSAAMGASVANAGLSVDGSCISIEWGSCFSFYGCNLCIFEE